LIVAEARMPWKEGGVVTYIEIEAYHRDIHKKEAG